MPEYKKYAIKDGRMVVKLDKVFYRCIESAKLCNQHLKSTLERREFVPYREKALTAVSVISSVL